MDLYTWYSENWVYIKHYAMKTDSLQGHVLGKIDDINKQIRVTVCQDQIC